jgi:hypothetical protein
MKLWAALAKKHGGLDRSVFSRESHLFPRIGRTGRLHGHLIGEPGRDACSKLLHGSKSVRGDLFMLFGGEVYVLGHRQCHYRVSKTVRHATVLRGKEHLLLCHVRRHLRCVAEEQLRSASREGRTKPLRLCRSIYQAKAHPPGSWDLWWGGCRLSPRMTVARALLWPPRSTDCPRLWCSRRDPG